MSTNLADILEDARTGDAFWVEGHIFGSKVRKILYVEHATPKQIKLSNGDYYWKRDGSPVSTSGSFGTIVSTATLEECTKFTQAEESKRQERDALKRKREAAAAKCDELEALFLPLTVTVVRPHNTKVNGEYVEFSLTLYGSESDVRRWAEQLKERSDG